MKRTLTIGLMTILLGVLFGTGIYFLQYHGMQKQSETLDEEQVRKTISGITIDIQEKNNTIRITETNGNDVLVSFTENTEIFDTSEKTLQLADLYPGFTLLVEGLVTKDKTMTADRIKVTKAPMVLLDSPKENSQIDYMVTLKGIIKTNASSLHARIMNTSRTVQYGQTTIQFEKPTGSTYKNVDTIIRLSRIPRRNTPVFLELAETTGKTNTVIHTISLEYAPLANP